MSHYSDFTIIIPTLNRKEDLVKTVRSVLDQKVLPKELVIVDQSKTKESYQVIQKIFSKRETNVSLRYIWDSSIPGLTHARNRGIQESSGDIIMFLDDDVELDENYTKEILEAFCANLEIGAVGGIVENYCMKFWKKIAHSIFCLGSFRDERWVVSSECLSNKKEEVYLKTNTLSGCNMAFRRHILDKIRFDENYRGYSFGEDIDISFRVSRDYKIFLISKARLIHKAKGRASKYEKDLRRGYKEISYSKYYFFKKNVPKTPLNILLYLWLNIGLVSEAIFLSVFRHKDISPIIGLFQGYIGIYRKIPINFLSKIS